MVDRLVEDLQGYFESEDDEITSNRSAVNIAARRAISRYDSYRRYPSDFLEQDKVQDRENHYYCILDIAIYALVKQGVEFQSTHSENNVQREWYSEATIFSKHGVYPIARLI